MNADLKLPYHKLYGLSFEDELSNEIFNSTLSTRMFGDKKDFVDHVSTWKSDGWRCYELEDALKRSGCSQLILYGAGADGRVNMKVLRMCSMPVLYVCDGNPDLKGTDFFGAEVIGPDDLRTYLTEKTLIVISSIRFQEAIRDRLHEIGIPDRQIYFPQYGNISAGNTDQYFDLFEPEEDEVFVDGGAYTGETSRSFVRWAKKGYKKIFAFEPIIPYTEAVKAQKLENIEWHQSALWSREENLRINLCDSSSNVYSGNGPVQGVPLDSIVGNERVTYIKYDLEGSERQALEGAKQTILRDKPKLAVCIYHNPEDIVEIPRFIHQLVPEYRMWIRHYHTILIETVLYCSL